VGGGIYSIHLFVHRLGSPFLIIRFVLKRDNLGKGGQKGAYILYICLFIDWVLPFCYKICIEKGQPVKRGPKGGIYSIHLFEHRLGSPFLL